MINTYWKQIIEQQDVRQNLSKLRQEIKTEKNRTALRRLIAGREELLTALLHAEDAKTRKNAALLLGDLGKQEFFEPIYEAYEAEQQKFVKSAYLAAMKNFDYRAHAEDFKTRLNILTNAEIANGDEKHIREELRHLSAMLVKLEGNSPHSFRGWNETYDVILLTNRNFAEVTKRELLELEPGAKAKIFGAGVMARVGNLKWMQDIRTYHELLFVIKGMKTCPFNPADAARTIVSSDFMEFMKAGHKGEPPYYFRIELKSKRPLNEKSAFVKKLSNQIETLSNRKLINTTSDYEVEIRLIENKEGNYNVLVKLYTWKDERFTYRREVMPSSIRAVNGALTAALAKEYMKKDAQVLDPFCGVGTMLIERHKCVPANTTYGIDIQEEAIVKARANTEAAHQIIHYINRDFFRFSHEYLFDEIITNMPFKLGKTTEEGVRGLYERFFCAAPQYLTPEGIMILYTHNRELVHTLAEKNGFHIIQEYEISKKEGTFVCILTRR